MYEYAIKNQSDLVQCDIDVVSDEGVVKTLTSKETPLSSDYLKRLIIDGDISNSLCNKLVKRTVYTDNTIKFHSYGMNEDNAVAIQLAYYSKRLHYTQYSYYKAYFNITSISRKPGEEQQLKKYRESFENSKFMVDFLLTNGYDLRSKAIVRAKMRPTIVLFTLLNKWKHLETWRETYSEVNFVAVFGRELPKGVRVRSLLALTCLYPMFYKIVTR
jgi:hypothetical protein